MIKIGFSKCVQCSLDKVFLVETVFSVSNPKLFYQCSKSTELLTSLLCIYDPMLSPFSPVFFIIVTYHFTRQSQFFFFRAHLVKSDNC